MGIVAALALIGALRYYRTVDSKALGYEAPWIEDVIRISPERFRGVVAMLPADAVLGYVSDLPISSQRGQVWVLGARDALAPRRCVARDRAEGGLGIG